MHACQERFHKQLHSVNSVVKLSGCCLMAPYVLCSTCITCCACCREEEAVNEAELSPEDFQDKKQRMKEMREQVLPFQKLCSIHASK